MERRGDSAGRRARVAIGQISRATAGGTGLPARLALAALLALITGAGASGAAYGAGVPAAPIPQNPSDLATAPAFTGAPAVPRTVSAPAVPQNPFMAPNG